MFKNNVARKGTLVAAALSATLVAPSLAPVASAQTDGVNLSSSSAEEKEVNFKRDITIKRGESTSLDLGTIANLPLGTLFELNAGGEIASLDGSKLSLTAPKSGSTKVQLKANPKVGPSLNIDLNVSAGDTTAVEKSTEDTTDTESTTGIADLFDRLSSSSETEGTANNTTENTDGTGSSTEGTGSSTDGTGSSTDDTGSSTDGTGSSLADSGFATEGALSSNDGSGSSIEGAGSSAEGQGTLTGSSQESGLPGKCKVALLGLGVPLLALIPVALVSQLAISGASQIGGQLGAQIRQANSAIQSQIGLLNPQVASQVESANAALKQFGLTAGSAALAVAGAGVGLALLAGVLAACLGDGSSSSNPADRGSSWSGNVTKKENKDVVEAGSTN